MCPHKKVTKEGGLRGATSKCAPLRNPRRFDGNAEEFRYFAMRWSADGCEGINLEADGRFGRVGDPPLQGVSRVADRRSRSSPVGKRKQGET